MAASTKKSMSGKKRKLGDQSVDEFLAGDFDSSGSESDMTSPKKMTKPVKQQLKKGKKQQTKKATKTGGVVTKHQESLERLKKQDPAFYKFLKNEDESLLKMDLSGSDVTDTSDDDASKSDDFNPNDDDDDSDDEEIDIGSDLDEEISQENIMKYLAKKNAEEIAKKKSEMEKLAGEKKSPQVKKFEEETTDTGEHEAKLSKKERKKMKKKEKRKAQKEARKNQGCSKGEDGSDETDVKIIEKSIKDTKKQKEEKKQKEKMEAKEKKEDKQMENEEDFDDDDDDDDGLADDFGGDDDEEDDVEGEDDDDDDDDNYFDSDVEDETFHKLPKKLKVMGEDSDDDDLMGGADGDDGDDDDESDDHDDEEEGDKKPRNKTLVTGAMIREWTKRFKTPSYHLIHDIVSAFRAAVKHTAADVATTKYKIEGADVYNDMVRLCLVEMPPALSKLLGMPETVDLQKPTLPSVNDKRWKKIKLDLRIYLSDVLQLLSGLTETNMVNVLLKHVHKLVAFYACFPRLTKLMLKKVVTFWSCGEETSRVLAFLCINRLIRLNQENMLETCVKQLYMAYVRNTKFTSPSTLPLINFMQQSFVEVLAIDQGLAYQYAFIYIRQLAIHLRNAITTKKKESCQAVYNWQFIHCVGLWSRVLGVMYPSEVMEPLIYPLVQVIIGTIKLIPTQRYYPLRIHCVKALTSLTKATRTFIPVLPFILEMFEQTDFNKKHKSISLKPFTFACMLKLSKSQLVEKAFKDGLIDMLYELLLEYFNAHAHNIGFPELVLPAMLQLKEFLKTCKVGNFTKQIKQIVDKVGENSAFISNRRRSVNISLADSDAIDRWERMCQQAGTPLTKFYSTWRKLRDRELMHAIAARDSIVDVELPAIVRPKPAQATDEEKKEFSALFDSDDDDDVDMTESFLPPDEKRKLQKERQQQEKTSKKGKVDKRGGQDDADSDYSDFDSDELEQLAGSADDDDDDDENGDDDAEDDNDDDDDDDDDDDEPQGDDIVKDFTMSSEDED